MSGPRVWIGCPLLALLLLTCSDPAGTDEALDVSGTWLAATPHGELQVTIEPYSFPDDLKCTYSMGEFVDGVCGGGALSGNEISLRLGVSYSAGFVNFTGSATNSSMTGSLSGSWIDYPPPTQWSYTFEATPVEFTR